MKQARHITEGEHEASILEKKHVNEVYDVIAAHFSSTRYKVHSKFRVKCGEVCVFVVDVDDACLYVIWVVL